ncbi:valyl-tRNA synthetase [Methanolacinia petrolearia DSM 11571]|uniref:Valine--tRNA ligase n=1 Tax=Methanolacinia petrolearia (strain DSM 11571 / OCM 486 / SEBR 4847) TaxID=679926 RepID=E1RDS2_METP4|nr:valine--tRNA ligase [Methanolacinia petrolearia]ADN37109.1 valyl-tRNA synthetase [Methanolacinia petrolearia DSM 11571]
MSAPKEIPKNYEPAEVEERWLKTWKKESYYFDPESKKPQFIIDTPPPYPTGNFHIGNAFNWCYIDFIARYKRMRGYNVMFPQGWDCHGLPTEVKVEELNGITKNDVPRQQFREMCRELTLKNIEKMRQTMIRCGFSNDWSNEYITMLPKYYRKTQLSFLRMYKKGDIYQSEHPVNFCTRCETAIAFAEVSYEDRKTKLNFFDFDGVEIATTRPELLAACVAVAVHPEDKRYDRIRGKTLKVPIFGHDVKVISDEAVDPKFGSGAVMICTFGDKQDVHWWKQHNLDLRKAIDLSGKMTAVAGKYEGMSSGECRKAILSDMESLGILKRQEDLEQRVGTCWRCKTPIEILSERQWFVKVHNEEILDAANQINWTPEHMKMRLENWASQMEWDWCISRQRIFATPIPVWFCSKCGEVILPDEEDLPIDPTVDKPKKPCPKCGSTEFHGEEDVLDTWMDSSISVLNITGWDGSGTPKLFPAQIRPQGHDIIRTWAFYTILRSVALTGSHPWENILVNGMVLGDDGFKMSKSRNNIIAPEEILVKYGADPFRQWSAAGASTGQDIVFNWNDVIAASRFQTKMWNINRFVLMHLERGYPEDNEATYLVDRWMMHRLSESIEEVTAAMEGFQFDQAIRAIREFARDVFADNYIELVKGRLYGSEEGRGSALYVLRTCLDALCRMLAPMTPFFAEECYSYLTGGKESVHAQPWVESGFKDDEAKAEGDLVIKIVSEIRRYKHDEGLALNAPLGHVAVYTPLQIDDGGDASATLNANVEWRSDKPDLQKIVSGVSFNMGLIGPNLRNKAKGYMDAVRSLSDEQKITPPGSVMVDGEEIAVIPGSFEPVFAYRVAGEEVDVLQPSEDVIITVQKE